MSQVLITKIVLGTLGCVPAYDRFFGIGVKYLGLEKDSCNEESFLELADFYEAHNDRLEEARHGMQCEVLTYPQMKLLDMGFGRSGSCEHKDRCVAAGTIVLSVCSRGSVTDYTFQHLLRCGWRSDPACVRARVPHGTESQLYGCTYTSNVEWKRKSSIMSKCSNRYVLMSDTDISALRRSI